MQNLHKNARAITEQLPNSTNIIWRAKHDGAFQKESRAVAKDQQHIQLGEQNNMESFNCKNSRAFEKNLQNQQQFQFVELMGVKIISNADLSNQIFPSIFEIRAGKEAVTALGFGLVCGVREIRAPRHVTEENFTGRQFHFPAMQKLLEVTLALLRECLCDGKLPPHDPT